MKTMNNSNSRHGFSRLEVIMAVVLVSVVVLFAFLINQFRLQRSGRASLISGFSAGTNAHPGADGLDSDAYYYGEAGTNPALESSEFNARSLAIVLPVAGGVLASNGVDDVAGGPVTNPVAGKSTKEEKRLAGAADDIQSELLRIAGMPWGPDADKQLQNVLARWAATDPAAALAYALSLESRRTGAAAVGNILAQWARSDPTAAYAWFNQHLASNPQMMSDAASSLFGKMAESDLDMALRNVWALPQQDMRNSALRAIASQMMASGKQDQLLQYFNTLSDTSAQSTLATILVDQWGTYYPEMTANWIATLTDPTVRYDATMALISKWGYDNPSMAAQWMASLPRDQNWGAEVNRMINTWAKVSPDKAANWLLTLFPPSTQLDPAIQSLVNTVMNANPEGAMAWADTITETRKRYSLMQQVGAIWMQKDPERATSYILSSDLPDSIKKRILKIR